MSGCEDLGEDVEICGWQVDACDELMEGCFEDYGDTCTEELAECLKGFAEPELPDLQNIADCFDGLYDCQQAKSDCIDQYIECQRVEEECLDESMAYYQCLEDHPSPPGDYPVPSGDTAIV